jgi:NAD+ synthase
MKYEVPFSEEYLTIIKQFIVDKVAKAGSNGLVLGLSGGLDSAMVLKLCTLVFLPEQITPVFLPETTTPTMDTTHARQIAEMLKVPLIEVPINDYMTEYQKIPENQDLDSTTLGNLKARIRMNIIYLIANSKNYLVVGTSNKSELLLGYFTKYGDGASDIAPIGDLYKTQVRELARVLELPNEIIEKPPTAGLVADQTDEDELGLDYGTIDKVLYALERSVSIEKIAADLGLSNEVVDDLKDRMEKNRHKRKFSKIPKIGIKTIGVDLYE